MKHPDRVPPARRTSQPTVQGTLLTMAPPGLLVRTVGLVLGLAVALGVAVLARLRGI